jgi:hypothetical protein
LWLLGFMVMVLMFCVMCHCWFHGSQWCCCCLFLWCCLILGDVTDEFLEIGNFRVWKIVAAADDFLLLPLWFF